VSYREEEQHPERHPQSGQRVVSTAAPGLYELPVGYLRTTASQLYKRSPGSAFTWSIPGPQATPSLWPSLALILSLPSSPVM